MNIQPVTEIGGYLAGSAVRFNGGYRRVGFATDDLTRWVTFKPICPEMSIGLPIPRPALHLVRTAQGNVHIYFGHAPGESVVDKMSDFTNSYLQGLGGLSGFIVCTKSPSYGMERVRLYDEKGNRGRKEGTGLFTDALVGTYPQSPVEEDGRLHNPVLRENFVRRVFAPHELNRLRANGLTRHGLLDFRSCYELQLLTHHRAGCREIDPFAAPLHQ